MSTANIPLIFYTHPQSRGRVVRWMLEEIGCPYQTELLSYNTTMKDPAYLAINPAGKVPALKHGDAIVTETVAICAYLADVFPEALLNPDASDVNAKADYYRWLFFVAGPLEAAVANKALNVAVPKEMARAIGHGGLDEVTAILSAKLQGRDYLAGNRFSAADLVVSSYLDFYTRFGVISADAEFARYIQLHKSRPAALRALEIDEQLSNVQ